MSNWNEYLQLCNKKISDYQALLRGCDVTGGGPGCEFFETKLEEWEGKKERLYNCSEILESRKTMFFDGK